MDKRLEEIEQVMWSSFPRGGRLRLYEFVELLGKVLGETGLQIVEKPTPEREALDKAMHALALSYVERRTCDPGAADPLGRAIWYACDTEALKQGILTHRKRPPAPTLEDVRLKYRLELQAMAIGGCWASNKETGISRTGENMADVIDKTYTAIHAKLLREHEAGR